MFIKISLPNFEIYNENVFNSTINYRGALFEIVEKLFQCLNSVHSRKASVAVRVTKQLFLQETLSFYKVLQYKTTIQTLTCFYTDLHYFTIFLGYLNYYLN